MPIEIIKGPEPTEVLRVGIGTPDEPFAPPWRFWTSGDSAYFAARSLGHWLKASFHPADARHLSAIWQAGFTRESEVALTDTGSRISHRWQQEPELEDTPGWYQGPLILFPRLQDRRYDLPPLEDFSDVETWVPAPEPGHTRSLIVFLADPDPAAPFGVTDDITIVGLLPMGNESHMMVASAERPLQKHEVPGLEEMRNGKLHVRRPASPGDDSAASIWVTSQEGPPLFVVTVFGSDNYQVEEPLPRPDGAD